jgi:hypothetical protein
MASILSQIRRECTDELSAIGDFARIPIIAEDRGDVTAQILRALAWDGGGLGKCGAFVYFLTEAANIRGLGEFGPVFGEIQISIIAAEHPELNRGPNGTGITALELAEKILASLNLFRPHSANGPLVARDPAILPSDFILDDNSALPAFAVQFELPGSLSITLQELAPVIIIEDLDTGLISMSCATPGAAIYYTTDLSRPNTTAASLYTAPISGLTGGTIIRARAFLAGHLLGPISEYEVEAEGDATYLVDENGARLTDEHGNRLTVDPNL